MATDNEIRKFIRDNMPQVKGNDRFMDELVRQIELLPVPASLAGKSEEEIRSAVDLIWATARKIKRRNRIKALSVTFLSIICLAVLLAVYYMVPQVHELVAQNYVYILAAFSAVILAAALLSLRHNHI
ncbi:MAG: hypothetical protein IAC23_05055 [Bacteroidetes bacterium]|uniref:Uncharacterized protein n=1 Tax=Candidatus Cryptobacteroides merdavium TaxID=2840769 RepID=A0A9D9HBR1_9BACT|nr:hypothetical protein [Candidatus Cryptobacteroides merdavium]